MFSIIGQWHNRPPSLKCTPNNEPCPKIKTKHNHNCAFTYDLPWIQEYKNNNNESAPYLSPKKIRKQLIASRKKQSNNPDTKKITLELINLRLENAALRKKLYLLEKRKK